jgi:hypothetical protein
MSPVTGGYGDPPVQPIRFSSDLRIRHYLGSYVVVIFALYTAMFTLLHYALVTSISSIDACLGKIVILRSLHHFIWPTFSLINEGR